MTNKRLWRVGLVVLAVGLVFVALLATRLGSVRGWIDDRYAKVEEPLDPELDSSEVYAASAAPRVVASDIADRWKPAERLVDPSGVFLRYADEIVAVTPAEEGSRIYVDDEENGYARWYGHVGGWWGTYSGPGESFRGGGPGAGK